MPPTTCGDLGVRVTRFQVVIMISPTQILIICLSLKLALDVYEYSKYQNGYTNIKTTVAAMSVAFTLYCGYYLLIRPVNIRRTLAHLGYDGLSQNQWASNERMNMIKQAMKLKKKGQMPPVFPNGWISLIESDQVKLEQVQYVSALGEHFAVFRSKNGIINILDAYCPHLGSNMAFGGSVIGNSLQCPFHGWTFSVIPRVSVKKWISCEENGFIFVWYHAEKEPPHWYPPKLINKNLLYRGRSEHYTNSHVQEIEENGADLSHFSLLHKDAGVGGLYMSQVLKSIWNYVGHHEWKSSWKVSQNEIHKTELEIEHTFELFNRFRVGEIIAKANQIGPGLVILNMKFSIGTISIIQVITPVEPLIQKIVQHVYCPWQLSLFAPLVLKMETIMLERDIVIWNHKTYVEKPLCTKEELTLLSYRQWFKQFYSENSPKFSFKKETMEW
ncbi:cholesterol 7-desaturase nvd isoform X2 [Adelges cooleyi]|uniref:cholesterol 7-desaturase nvd isoform X2 n=1 Tax=Adelges cooleyi TaxID=133065 RepID=UPI00217FE573|nr:cholesterol 7-desaturase nvd isoform X2 [Adelges cooleyi]